MGKNYLRIDDRLIHGQIVTAWCSLWKIGEIIAIDDKLATNPTLQKIMLMGVPANYKAHVLAMEDAKKLLAEESEKNRLFIVRVPSDLLNLMDELKKCECVVIGNAAKRPDAKYNLTKGGGSVFFASDSDVALFDEIEKQGIELIYQTIPKSPARSWSAMRKFVK